LKETTIIKQQAFPKTSVNAGWGAKYQDGSVYSITSRVPMHEPWVVSDRAGWAGGPTPTPHAAADPCKPPPAKKETAAPTTSWWTDDEFINAVQNVSAKYKIDDWRDLLAVMYFETARTMNPAKRNSNSGAVGLIQFVEKTARSLGTTTDKLETLSRYDQMAWVDKYFSRSVLASAKSPVGLNDLYMSVFYPVGFDKPDDYVLIAAKEIGVDGQGRPKYQLEYEQNKGLDGLDGSKPDLKITKGEACASLATYKADVIKKLN
jgi:hypothetical protein